jgi:hypothetical protein
MIYYFRTVLHEAVLRVARLMMIYYFRTVMHEAVLCLARQLMISCFRTVLHEAVLCDDVFKMNRLLDEGANPNVQETYFQYL